MATIPLRFKKDVYIQINGDKFEGKEIEAKNIQQAAEIVRLARAGYGSDILL